ncbi:GCN5 family acetyltransferase [Nocardioides sp. Soil805]|nr:GCN5 family acetyltransferase [Nocardioides sp. Soil805]
MDEASTDVRWPIRSNRLTIRPATPKDVEATWNYRRLPEVFEWLPRSAPTRDVYASAFVESPRLERTLVVEHEGVVVGDLYLHVHDAWAQAEVASAGVAAEAEIGWVLDPQHGGRGLATEAVAALIEACFFQLTVRRVHASCIADNVPSWRLMERLGMRREGHGRNEALHRDRGWLDGYHYAVLATEWPRGS